MPNVMHCCRTHPHPDIFFVAGHTIPAAIQILDSLVLEHSTQRISIVQVQVFISKYSTTKLVIYRVICELGW